MGGRHTPTTTSKPLPCSHTHHKVGLGPRAALEQLLLVLEQHGDGLAGSDSVLLFVQQKGRSGGGSKHQASAAAGGSKRKGEP
jgi:hypothetical protein